MVDSVATVALETLTDLLIEEAKFLSSVSGQVEEVRRQLQTMHAFLKDADRRQDSYNSETVRDWIVELRRLSTKAEDVLERYAIQVTSRKGKNLKKVLKKFACILGECLTVHQIGNEIKDIRSRMADLTNKAESITKGASSSSGPTVDDAQWSSRRTYGHEVEKHFVGMKGDIDRLKSLVTSDDESNRVISICGMGGLGKTTLANKIYQMEAVHRCFDARAWVCISQQFQRKNILQELLKQLLPNEGGDLTEDALVRKLYNVQKEKKCLVVLDDIWEVGHWDSLKCAFPIGEERCKVLLTSRNEKIAATEYVYKLKCLTEDEGWELLQKIALPNNHSQGLSTTEVEGIGREIVKKCGCLPLPISVIGGILLQEKTRSEWEKVCKSIDAYVQRGKGVEENKKVRQVLDLSYNVLPYNLKPCFLYLGCFPEDQKIETETLYLLWMAEGMISSEDRGRGETLRDVAERYLSELANRCMVQVEMDEKSIYNRLESCRLHDLMRDLCLSKGKDEGFLEVVDREIERQDASSSVSRLAIHLDKAEDYLFERQNLRSLLILKKRSLEEYRDGNNLVSINFGMYRSLKILILKYCQFQKGQFPKAIEKLIMLKHLSLYHSLVDELPRFICKLPCLQSLDLRTFGSIRLPNSIHKITHLKHLFLNRKFRSVMVSFFDSTSVIGGGKLKLNGLNELETFIGFDSSLGEAANLIELPKLRVLDGSIGDEYSLSTIVDHILNHQDQFRETRFHITSQCSMTMNSEIDAEGSTSLLGKTLMCLSLCYLDIRCRVNKLPSYEPQLGRNLIELLLKNSFIEEDPMEMLEKLPMLRYLRLSVGAFVRREMVCRANGFPQLRNLVLWDLSNLVEWRVEEKAMPNLSSVSITACTKLEMIPEGLKFINTLKELNIWSMPEEFMKRVRVVKGEAGEDYHKIKHIPSIDIL